MSPGSSRAGSEPVEVEVEVRVVISDPDALRAYVRRRYAACWFAGAWAPADLAEAVLEALVLSNENPSPADYGIEILESNATEMPAGPGKPRGSRVDRPRKGGGES